MTDTTKYGIVAAAIVGAAIVASKSKGLGLADGSNVKPKEIEIWGRVWFDKVNGNSYNSARVYVNGDFVFSVPFGYGYDEMYAQRSWEELIERGYLPKSAANVSRTRYCREHDIDYIEHVTKGKTLKRDVKQHGESNS